MFPLTTKIILAICAAIALAGVILAGRSHPPAVAAPKGPSFDRVWHENAVAITLGSFNTLSPRPVKTETITPKSEVVVPVVEPPKPATKVRTVSYDICRGKGKRYIRGGKSWRCRR
jgi:hypothetical protein